MEGDESAERLTNSSEPTVSQSSIILPQWENQARECVQRSCGFDRGPARSPSIPLIPADSGHNRLQLENACFDPLESMRVPNVASAHSNEWAWLVVSPVTHSAVEDPFHADWPFW